MLVDRDLEGGGALLDDQPDLVANRQIVGSVAQAADRSDDDAADGSQLPAEFAACGLCSITVTQEAPFVARQVQTLWSVGRIGVPACAVPPSTLPTWAAVSSAQASGARRAPPGRQW